MEAIEAMGETLPFWQSVEFWREPILGAIITAFACGFVGVYVVLKRIVFVTAALSQIASVGVATTYWIFGSVGITIGQHQSFLKVDPFFISLIFVIIGALLLSLETDVKRVTKESIVGFAYLLSSSLVLLIGSQIPQGTHDINNILFGNAVAVELSQLKVLSVVVVILLLIHLIFFKEFVFVSFDKDTAQTLGLPTRLFNAILLVSIGILIAIATRTIGALPVFSFVVLPPIGGLLLAKSLKGTFVISIVLAVVSAFLGYYFSWIWELPTGATMAGVSGMIIIPIAIFRRLKG